MTAMGAADDQRAHKARLLRRVRRAVVKIGSNVLAGPNGLRRERVRALATEIAALAESGRQIVVVSSSDRETVKRVVSPPAQSGFWVEGDNRAASTDSRSFGPVPRAKIAGVVRACYWPLERARVFR